ncbi:response regulator [Aestuariibacter salexigens]|uniref:response regulator n=1 Tax=Aestuariibacter salexigens TaxID=226010 RepID=UPI0003FAEFB1|nr:response regulator [Aestuariibacter salexigens]
MRLYSQSFTLQWQALTSFRMNLFHVLREQSVDTMQIDSAGLVFTEYLTNLLRHAQGDGEPLLFDVRRNGDILTLRLQDKTACNHALHKMRSKEDHICHTESENNTLREGGMGLGLIQTLYPDFLYQSEGGINTFELCLKASTRKPSVMIVDDSPSSLALLNAYLNDGFDVITFTSPLQALTALMHEPPDIVIVDIHMPDLSGDRLIDKLRQHEKLHNTKIIVITGEIDSEQAREANLMGIDAMLSKPTSKAELQRVLAMVLSNTNMAKNSSAIEQVNETECFGEVTCIKRGSVNIEQSGDLLITLRAAESHFLILIDLMGHGHQAAIHRQKLIGFFTGLLASAPHTPATLMNTFSQAVFDGLLDESQVYPSVICKITDRHIEWTAAGHPPPMLIGTEQLWCHQHEVQPLPGLVDAQQYDNQSIALDAQHRLLLYTDGMFENHSRHNTGAENLINHLSTCESCQHVRQQEKTHDVDNQLINCLWRNSLPLLSKEIDDASLIILM